MTYTQKKLIVPTTGFEFGPPDEEILPAQKIEEKLEEKIKQIITNKGGINQTQLEKTYFSYDHSNGFFNITHRIAAYTGNEILTSIRQNIVPNPKDTLYQTIQTVTRNFFGKTSGPLEDLLVQSVTLISYYFAKQKLPFAIK